MGYAILLRRSATATLFGAFGLATAVAISASARAADSDVVASVDGREITSQQVDAKIKPELTKIQNELYEARKSAADEMIDDYLIEKAAKKAGVSKEAYLKREIEDKAPAPDDKALQQFYDQHKEQIRQPFDKIKDALSNYMRRGQLGERHDKLIAKLRSSANYKVNLEPARFEVGSNGSPALGPKDAPVTIVEFSDFQCPFCRRAEDSLHAVRDKYGDKVRLVYRDFPLSMHDHAIKASEAGQCANEQDKFWQFHDAVFADQSRLAPDDLKATAAKLKLDTDKFNQCLDADKYLDGIHKDMSEGNSLGVSGTPTFFINGRFLNGAQPPKAFEEVIDDELAHNSHDSNSR